MFRVDPSVPVRVIVLLAVKVLPSAIVSVEPVAGAVIATLLMLVAVATPNDGVVRVGLVKVLFVRVSVPARVAKVPEVGRVTVPVPAVAAALSVVVPEVAPFKSRVLELKDLAPVTV
jgi:hypothetical protein